MQNPWRTMTVDAIPQDTTSTEKTVRTIIIQVPDGVVVDLAAFPGNAHIDVEALAKILHRHKRSITRAIYRGELPPPFRFMATD